MFDAEFLEDDLEMFLFGVGRERKVDPDFFVRFSHDEPVKNADFARGERQAEAAGVSMTRVCLVVLLI